MTVDETIEALEQMILKSKSFDEINALNSAIIHLKQSNKYKKSAKRFKHKYVSLLRETKNV